MNWSDITGDMVVMAFAGVMAGVFAPMLAPSILRGLQKIGSLFKKKDAQN